MLAKFFLWGGRRGLLMDKIAVLSNYLNAKRILECIGQTS
jgi:hypothetical protein